MKRTFVSIIVSAVCGVALAHGTSGTSSVSVGAVSSSQAQASSGVNGGSSISVAGNRQTAFVAPGSSYAVQGSVLGQVVGTAGVSGSVGTSSSSFAGNLSTGSAGGSAQAGGTSVANLSASQTYNAGSSVTGNVSGGSSALSGSQVGTGTNGAAGVSVSGQGSFGATAQSTRTGIFTTERTAATTAGATATTSPLSAFNVGNAGYSVSNQATAGAGANAVSGSVSSSN